MKLMEIDAQRYTELYSFQIKYFFFNVINHCRFYTEKYHISKAKNWFENQI